MNSAQAVAWIVEFQKELRNLLPLPYIISHAPVAPWFTSANDYADGSYVSIHQQVGDTIDFYNVQFYNQGADQYVTCEVSSRVGGGIILKPGFRRFSLILGANGLQLLYLKSIPTPACPWIRLSLASHWVPTLLPTGTFFFMLQELDLDKLMMKRYMSASDLQVCVGEAEEKGWNAGIMFWQWGDVSVASRPNVVSAVYKERLTGHASFVGGSLCDGYSPRMRIVVPSLSLADTSARYD